MNERPDFFELGRQAAQDAPPLTDEQRREAVRLLRPYVLAKPDDKPGADTDTEAVAS